MKIFIFLLALVCGSNATLSKLLAAFGASSRILHGGDSGSDSRGPGAGNGNGGAGGGGSYGGGPSDGRGPGGGYGGGWPSGGGYGGNSYAPNYQYSHGGIQGGAAPPVYRVILERDPGFGNVGYAGGQSYSGGNPMGGFNGGYGQGYPDASAAGQTEIYQIINENAGPSGYGSHDSGYPRGNDGSAFQLESILPQILQAIFQADAAGPGGGSNGFGGNNNFNLQVADNFDQSGRASIAQGGSQRNNYFNSGRVVESGELRIRRITQGRNAGGASQGPPGGHPLAALLSSGSPSSEW